MNYAIYYSAGKLNNGYLITCICGLILCSVLNRWLNDRLNIMFENTDENKKFKTIFDNQDESIIIIKQE